MVFITNIFFYTVVFIANIFPGKLWSPLRSLLLVVGSEVFVIYLFRNQGILGSVVLMVFLDRRTLLYTVGVLWCTFVFLEKAFLGYLVFL